MQTYQCSKVALPSSTCVSQNRHRDLRLGWRSPNALRDMSHKPQIEAQIRDYLSRRVDRLPGLITNLCAIKEEHQARLDAFLRISEEQGGPTPTDLLRRILTKRNFSGPPRRESTGACDTFNCEPIDGKIVRSMVATVPPRVYLCYSRADAL